MKITEALRGQTAFDAVSVTPHDTNDNIFDRLYIGNSEDVEIVTAKGNTTVFKNVPTGMTLPVSVAKVKDANTTATYIVGLKKL